MSAFSRQTEARTFALGAEGREFESRRPDHNLPRKFNVSHLLPHQKPQSQYCRILREFADDCRSTLGKIRGGAL